MGRSFHSPKFFETKGMVFKNIVEASHGNLFSFEGKPVDFFIRGQRAKLDVYEDGAYRITKSDPAGKHTEFIEWEPEHEHRLRPGVSLHARVEAILAAKAGFNNTADYQLTLVRGMNPMKLSQSDEDTLKDLLEEWSHKNPHAGPRRTTTVFQLIQLKSAMGLELKGLKHSKGSAIAFTRKLFGAGKNVPAENLIGQAQALIDSAKASGANMLQPFQIDIEGMTYDNPLKAGGKYAKFIHRRLEDPKKFDKRSFRIKKLPNGIELVIGCPAGKWDEKTKRCSIGTRTQAMLIPKGYKKNPFIAGPLWGNDNPPVLIGRRVKAVEYYDEKKARAEGLQNPKMPWRHEYKMGGPVIGLANGDILIKAKKKKLWGYR